MKISMPENVNQVIAVLLAHGHEAYAVGGCIRDSLLSRKADDWDITTSASPYEVKSLFKRTVDTGIQHGTVTVLLDKDSFEVTTYRIDGEYEDGRHPKQVEFTKSLAEDLRRRDFTINAMAYNEENGLVDLFGGREDLEHKVIRCVGTASERFEEDALRILRAFRFSAQLGFAIEETTRREAAAHAEDLRKISAERIRTELDKLLLSEHPELLLSAFQSGITAVVLPEFDQMFATPQRNTNHQYNVGEHVLHTIGLAGNGELQAEVIRKILPGFDAASVTADRAWSKKELRMLRWSALLHDVAKPETHMIDRNGEDHFPDHAKAGAVKAKTVLQRLKFDNETIDYVVRLVEAHDYCQYEKTDAGLRKMMNLFGPGLMEMLWELQLSDVLAQSPALLEQKLSGLALAKQLHRTVVERGDCVELKQLAVNGRDLMEAGFASGPQIGKRLSELLELVLEEPEQNTKEALLLRLKGQKK